EQTPAHPKPLLTLQTLTLSSQPSAFQAEPALAPYTLKRKALRTLQARYVKDLPKKQIPHQHNLCTTTKQKAAYRPDAQIKIDNLHGDFAHSQLKG
ncbi:hypothetical protein, partial [Pseudomonas sp.]|uniref:hypothetical protein n=1 Tax=Pseudomonas sp. TaxID=306 RepID=UPI002585AC1C